MRSILCTAIFLFGLVLTEVAFGYVGPGAGITMLAALWAVLAAVVAALIAILYWPIEVLIRKLRNRHEHLTDDENTEFVENSIEDAEPDERPGKRVISTIRFHRFFATGYWRWHCSACLVVGGGPVIQ